MVLSSGELIIANWLFKKGIEYNYDRKLDNSDYRSDFYLLGMRIHIEYFGMQGVTFYDKQMKKKLSFYRENGIKMLPIFPKDNIQQVLDRNLLNYKLV